MPIVSDIVANVLDRCAGLGVDGGGYVRAFLQGATRMDARMDDAVWQDILKRLLARLPAVMVAADEFRAFEGSVGGRALEWDAELEVYVYAATDYRGSLTDGRLDPSAQAQADPTADQGARQLAEDLFRLLAGWAPADAAAQMLPIRGHTVHTTTGLTVWEWEFATKVRFISEPLEPAVTVTSVHVDNQTTGAEQAIITSEDLP